MLQANWYVLIVDPLREHLAVDRLNARGFRAYTPCIWRRQRGGRGRVIEMKRAMFPCYAFIEFEKGTEDWPAVERVQHVWRFMRVEGRPVRLPGEAMDAIQAKEADLEQLHLARQRPVGQYNFEPGQRVMVRVGPFADMLATVGRLDDRSRVEILLSMLGAERRALVESAELIAA